MTNENGNAVAVTTAKPDHTAQHLQPDYNAARAFLQALDAEADAFTFQTFTDTAKGVPQPRPDPLAVVRTGPFDDLASWLAEQNARGAGVFVTVNETDYRGRRMDNIARVRAVWQEDDGEGKPLPLDPQIEVQSSPGKVHRYLLCDGIEVGEHRALQARLVADYGSDPNAADVARVLRVPGFYHRKGVPHMVRLLRAEPCLPYSRAAILAALPPVAGGAAKPKAAPANAATMTVNAKTVTELRSALAALRSDDRATWIAIGQNLKSLGEVGRGLWIEWAQQSDQWKPADARTWDNLAGDRSDYRAVFTKAQAPGVGWVNPMSNAAVLPARSAIEAANDPAWGFVWGDTLTSPTHLKPSEWAIRRILPKECTGLLFGGWGTCKTFLAIDWAGCIANGIDWHGKPTQKGSVIYLAGEGEGGFARRLAAWEIKHRASMAGLAFREMPEIRKPEELARLLEIVELLAAERGNPRLIVIDTLFTALNGGEENGGKDMGEVFSAMRTLRQKFHCAVIAVHHTGHDGDRSRGHSSMPAGVDVQFYIKAKDMADGNSALELANPKQKDGRKHPTIFLTTELVAINGLIDEEGETESSLVIAAPTQDMLATMEANKESGKDLSALKLEAAKLRSQGLSFEKIGLQLDRDKATISRWMKELEQAA